MKVSVVVPVCDPGEHFTPCVESLLAQSLDDYEVIFADDGSTDGTERRLDALATAHDRIRVLHLPASGGPGGPRNAGLAAARGDYVYFLDDDDRLGPEALERMYAMAERNGSDIVIGKMIGEGRTVPKALFRTSRDRADILGDRLYGLLTAHKLFRRSFLNEQGIRFPEGPVRLEDHRFVLPAYFRAGVISVLADYPCCRWVRRAGSYSHRRPDPAAYYAALREVLDIVDEYVPPGPERDRLYLHWYRGKVLKRIGEAAFLAAPPDYRKGVYEEVRRLSAERFGPGLDPLVPVRLRARAALLRAGAYDDLFRLAEADRQVRLHTVLDGLGWDGDRLAVRFGARLAYADGTPLTVCRGQWQPPVPVPLAGHALHLGDAPVRLDLYVRGREDGADYLLECDSERVGGSGLARSGVAVFDAWTARDGSPLHPGVWDFVARLDGGGWTAERRLAGRSARYPARGVVEPYETSAGNLSVRVRRPEALPGLRRALRRTRVLTVRKRGA